MFYGTTAGPLARRHGIRLAPAQLSGWSLAVWALVLARKPVLALTALSASIAILAHRLRGLVRDPWGWRHTSPVEARRALRSRLSPR